MDRVLFLIVHGWLHLQGYDHERSPEDGAAHGTRTGEILARMKNEQRRKIAMNKARLAVNVDHVATLRQARMGIEPDPVLAAGIAELAGAEGIIVHLREDRRHIQDRDLRLLRETVQTKLNLEMGAAEEIIRIALKVQTGFCHAGPGKKAGIDHRGGAGNRQTEKEPLPDNRPLSPRPHRRQPVHRRRSRTDPGLPGSGGRHRGAPYRPLCQRPQRKRSREALRADREGAEQAAGLGLKVSAGHGLNYVNIKRFAGVGEIEEYSIGHSLMARAIYVGLDQAVREMIALIEQL